MLSKFYNYRKETFRLGVDRRTILKCILKRNWVDLAQGNDYWRVLVNAALYLRNAFKILTGKPTGKGPLGRRRRRWGDNIRVELKEIGINMRNLSSFGSE